MKSPDLSTAWLLIAAPSPREMCIFWAIKQVKRLEKTLILVFYVYMLTSVVLAVPRPAAPVVSEDNMGRQVITFYNQPCIPVDPKLLHQRMGPAFDSDRMAMDEASTKRSALRTRSSELADEEDGYLEDEDEDEDGLEDEEESEYEEELESQEKKGPSDYSVEDNRWSGRFKRNLVKGAQGKFYNRNNRKSLKNKKRWIRKDLKSILKRLERQQRKRRNPLREDSTSHFHPPWECEMEVKWEKFDPEYFPRYLQTGKCRTQRCVVNLYECIPKLYPVKILRRDPNRCNPLPSIGFNTTYEERWYFERKHVTVCCECGRRVKPSRRRSRKLY